MMEKAFDFLSRHKDVAFATVEQDKPKIRVFQIMRQEGHTLYLYKRYTDLVYFRLPIAKLDYYDLSPTPPVFEHYEFGEPV